MLQDTLVSLSLPYIMHTREEYFIGVDIGTSSSKALAFTLSGKIASQHQISLQINHPNKSQSEQNPNAVLQATTQVIRRVVKEMQYPPLAVSFSSAMHSIMAVDKKGAPLTPLLLWSDNRSHEEAAHLKRKKQAIEFYRHTGTPIHPMSPLCKLLWWRNHQKSIFDKAHKFISAQEYVFHHYFGKYIIGYSQASATGLFDHQELKWHQPALEYTSISKEKLSQLVPSTHIIKGLRSEAASQLGLDKQTSFIIGASDGCLANLGSGVIHQGEMALSIGTSGAVRITRSNPIKVSQDNQGSIFNYLLTEKEFVSGGAINNGGNVLNWYKNNFLKGGEKATGYETIIKQAMASSAGARGLLFLPYIHGERAPFWDANAKGCFFGISHQHQINDFSRAILEGICFALAQNIHIINNNMAEEINAIHVSGGFTQSKAWVQLLTDIIGKEVKVSNTADASALGAVFMGMKALGIIPEWSEIEKYFKKPIIFQPQKKDKKIYDRNYAVFSKMYAITQPLSREMSAWKDEPSKPQKP